MSKLACRHEYDLTFLACGLCLLKDHEADLARAVEASRKEAFEQAAKIVREADCMCLIDGQCRHANLADVIAAQSYERKA